MKAETKRQFYKWGAVIATSIAAGIWIGSRGNNENGQSNSGTEENPVDTKGHRLKSVSAEFLMENRPDGTNQSPPIYYETTLITVPDPIIGSPFNLTYNGVSSNYLLIRTTD